MVLRLGVSKHLCGLRIATMRPVKTSSQFAKVLFWPSKKVVSFHLACSMDNIEMAIQQATHLQISPKPQFKCSVLRESLAPGSWQSWKQLQLFMISHELWGQPTDHSNAQLEVQERGKSEVVSHISRRPEYISLLGLSYMAFETLLSSISGSLYFHRSLHDVG